MFTLNVLLVFSTAITYVLHSVLVKYGALKIDIYSSIFFWSLGTFLLGLLSLSYGKITEQSSFALSSGLLASAAGFTVALGTFAYFAAFARNVDFSFATPVVNVSVVLGGVIFGYFLFSEHISLYRITGVVLGILSIFFMVKS